VPELLVGFRFHPTDEELITHYLGKKVSSAPLPAPIIADIDPYQHDPWDLPAKAFFGENEWYFFSPRNREYLSGARPNRAAGSGYWKSMGSDIPIVNESGSTSPSKVGVKKSLVFYKGKAAEGVMTNWIMHEYYLAQTLPTKRKGSVRLDDWVLCRLFQRLNHSPGMLSCSQLEVPQRTRQKPAMPKFSSFSRVPLNEGPSMENLPSHATSDANNAAVSSAESTSSLQVVPHPLNSSESRSHSSMNWSAQRLQEMSSRRINIFDIFLIKIRREKRGSNPSL